MNPRAMLAAACSLFVLFCSQLQAQDSGYSRTYVIQADGAWISPSVHIEPAFVKVSAGKIVWVSSTDQREERKSMLGGKATKDPLIKVQGWLAPGVVDSWTTMVPSGYSQDRHNGVTEELADALPMQVVNEDELLVGQVLAARQAGVAAVFMSASRSGWRRGVGSAVEFSKLDLPMAVGEGALEFAVGVQANSGFDRTYMMEELEAVFAEAKTWRESWDSFDESMQKYTEDLKKYEEKLTEYIEEKKKFDEEANKPGAKAQDGEKDKNDKKEPKAPKRPRQPIEPQTNSARALILGAIDGQYIVRVHADNVSDIKRVIKLKKEYGLKLVVVGGDDADLLTDALRQAEIGVILPLVNDFHAAPLAERSLATRFTTLTEGGVEVALASAGAEGLHMLMMIRAGELVAAGCAKDKVWDALTVAPARMLGLEDYGTLHRGKSATMILFEGTSPFDASAPMKAHKPK